MAKKLLDGTLGSKTDMSSLIEYRNNVESLAEMKSDLVFRNKSATHAAIVLENIFSSSNEVVRILSNRISKDVSNQFPTYCDAVEKFLMEGGVIKVIHYDDLDLESDIVKLLMEYKTKLPSQVLIKSAEQKVLLDFADGDEIHYSVGDDNSYRVEVDTKTREAFVCFNDKEVARELINVFDDLFES
jgi:hypothetical protein